MSSATPIRSVPPQPPGPPLRIAPPPPPPGGPRRFTVDEYHRMINAGVLTEDDPVELLEGWIVYKMPRDPEHDVGVKLAEVAVGARLPAGWHYRTQSAITTSDSEPEPDGAVVRGDVRDYVRAHPMPPNVALLVEVANSTLAADRAMKAALYARAGVRLYWIVNLIDRLAEVYSDPSGQVALPSYRQRRDYGAGEDVPLQLPDGLPAIFIPAAELLP